MSNNNSDLNQEAPDSTSTYTRQLSTSPRYLSTGTSSQNTQYRYLSNSPQQEIRSSFSPSSLDTDTRNPHADPQPSYTQDLHLFASPTAQEHGEPFSELSDFQSHTHAHAIDAEIHVQHPSTDQDEMEPMERIPFASFFTLITDSTFEDSQKDGDSQTPTTYHPSRIHYLFSDDDESEVLKDALLRCIPDESHTSDSRDDYFTHKNANGLGISNSGLSSRSRNGTIKDGKGKEGEERIILVDMNVNGDRVLRAQSLSPNWQVTGCEIGKAPIWESEGGGGGGGGEGGKKEDRDEGTRKRAGLMLRIDGVGITGEKEGDLSGSRSRNGEKGKGREIDDGEEEDEDGELDMEKLLEGFDRKMGVLRKVVGGVGWDAGHGGGGAGTGAGVGEDIGMGNMDGEGEGEGDIPPVSSSYRVGDEHGERGGEGEAF